VTVLPELLDDLQQAQRLPIVRLDDLPAKGVGQAIGQGARRAAGRCQPAIQAVGGLDGRADQDEGPPGPKRAGLVKD